MAGHRRELRATRIKKELTHHEGARQNRHMTVPAGVGEQAPGGNNREMKSNLRSA
jgi:hypothetical protein